ncbi:MAG: hypothetical protein ABI557_00880, partial [Aureliella sp.]
MKPSDIRRLNYPFHLVLGGALVALLWWIALTSAIMAQEPEGKGAPQKPPPPNKEELAPAPAKVDVQPIAHDEEIRKRLQSTFDATTRVGTLYLRADDCPLDDATAGRLLAAG